MVRDFSKGLYGATTSDKAT